MLNTLKTLLVLILLAGWVLAGLSLHVVRWPGAYVWIGIVPKDRLGVFDTYVDVRTWTKDDVTHHSALARRLVEAGKTHWLEHIVSAEELPSLIRNSDSDKKR